MALHSSQPCIMSGDQQRPSYVPLAPVWKWLCIFTNMNIMTGTHKVEGKPFSLTLPLGKGCANDARTTRGHDNKM